MLEQCGDVRGPGLVVEIREQGELLASGRGG
jgi:hypothetical protein